MDTYTAAPRLDRAPPADVHPLREALEALEARGPATLRDRVRCPACHRIADVVDRFDLESTDGPVEHVRLRCDEGRHHFTMPVESLTTR